LGFLTVIVLLEEAVCL